MTERAGRYGLREAVQKGGWDYGAYIKGSAGWGADSYHKDVV